MTDTKRFIQRAALPALAAFGCLLANPLFRLVEAQDTRPRVQTRIFGPDGMDIIRLPELLSAAGLDPKRAVIGVTVTTSNKSDTLGLLVDDVTKGGPAEKAGIRVGSRITSVNGVNLRLSAADADDPEMQGIAQRRLQREVAKAKPGDDVEVRVTEAGQAKTIRIKTVTAADLMSQEAPRFMPIRGDSSSQHASLGMSIGNTGSMRDTLGLFVASVINNGPAEKAGVFEGDRIAAINGNDVRVPREDAEDSQASSARLNRFMRELDKTAPGDKITLKVYANGRYRDVQVTAGRSSELRSQGFRLNFGDSPMTMSLPRRVQTIPKKSGAIVIRRGALVL